MGFRVRQVRQLLGLATATALCALLAGAQAGSAPNNLVLQIQPLDDELLDYPFLYAVEVGRWYLNDEEAAKLRDYLLRGGFLMVDDFHGSLQWEGFMESMRRVFPDREVVEIPDNHEVFHVVWDLGEVVGGPHKVQ